MKSHVNHPARPADSLLSTPKLLRFASQRVWSTQSCPSTGTLTDGWLESKLTARSHALCYPSSGENVFRKTRRAPIQNRIGVWLENLRSRVLDQRAKGERASCQCAIKVKRITAPTCAPRSSYYRVLGAGRRLWVRRAGLASRIAGVSSSGNCIVWKLN